MVYWHLFLAFLIPSIVGYGGGPASIPLIQHEVTNHYDWYTVGQFGELLAAGNALPGPIATKLAGYIGYEQAGIAGMLVALFATVAPSLVAMIALLHVLNRFRHSPRIGRMTGLIKPAIVVLMGVLSWQMLTAAWQSAGALHTLILMAAGFLCLEKWKLQPAYVIVGALAYGFFLI